MEFDQFKNINKAQFEAIYQLNRALGELENEKDLLTRILDVVLNAIKARRGFIVTFDHATDSFHLQMARNIAAEDIPDLQQASSSILWEAVHSGQPVLSYDAQSDQRFQQAESVILHDVRSVIAVPLKRHGSIEGVIYLDSTIGSDTFVANSLDFLNFFASQAALVLENARLYEQVCAENILLKKEIIHYRQFDELVGASPAMKKVFDLIQKISRSDASVLILGESGTGKELAAKAIHNKSRRAGRPFVAQYCGALTESLLESELFGHVKGAYTGAIKDNPGLFELANGGSFFLDEIGDVSANIQAKFLRVLQAREIKRVGETRMRQVDVRIIAATNKNLWEMVQQNKFREDLYYRLNVVSLELPPLREHKSDIPILTAHFIKKHREAAGTEVKGINEAAVRLLGQYDWPGNVRELENAIKRALVLADSAILQPDDFMFLGLPAGQTAASGTLAEFERQFVLEKLAALNGDKNAAALDLGVSLRWLYYKLKEWGL